MQSYPEGLGKCIYRHQKEYLVWHPNYPHGCTLLHIHNGILAASDSVTWALAMLGGLLLCDMSSGHTCTLFGKLTECTVLHLL